MYYIITNEDGTKIATHDGFMLPVCYGGRAPFTTTVRATAERWTDSWIQRMRRANRTPYELTIKEVA